MIKKHYAKDLKYCVFIVISMTVFCSCNSTLEIVREVPVYLHDTSEVVSVQKDSVFVHDSTYVYKNGDTLYISKWLTRYVERVQHDTLLKVQEVPVEVVCTEVREVEVPLTKWQKFRLKGFWWLAIGLIGYVLWRTRALWGRYIKH